MMIYENYKLKILLIFSSILLLAHPKSCQTSSDCKIFKTQVFQAFLTFENVNSNQNKNSVGTEYCLNSLCVSCIEDFHCNKNFPCIQNKCTCSVDSDCADHSICNFGFCLVRPKGCNYFTKSTEGVYCESCISGHSLAEGRCVPTCGDGTRIFDEEQCDDGNLENGDGCSNRCEIEENWECDIDTLKKVDVCKKKIINSRILENTTTTTYGFELSFDGYSISLLGAIGITSFPLILGGKDAGAFMRVYGNLQSIMIMQFFSAELGKEFKLLTSMGGILFWNYVPNPFGWFGISFNDLVDKNISSRYSNIGLTKIFLRDYAQILLLFAGAIMIEILTRILLLIFTKSRFLNSTKNVLGVCFITRFLLLNPLVTLIPAFLQIFSIASRGIMVTLSIVASVCVFCFYLGIMLFFILKQQKIILDSEEEELQSQKTSIFFELHSNIDKTGVLSFYFWQILRAILVSLLITILENNPRFQIGSHTVISVVYLLLVLKLRPFTESKENTRQICLETGVTIISVIFLTSTFIQNDEIISAINGSVYVVVISYLAFSFLLMISLVSKPQSEKKKSAQVHTQKTSETMMEINKFSSNQDTSELDISKYPTKSCSHKASQDIISISEQPNDDKPKLDLTHVLNSMDLKKELAKYEKEINQYNSRPPRDLKKYKQPDTVLHKKFASQSSIEIVSPSLSELNNSIDGVLDPIKDHENKQNLKPLTPITIQSDQSNSEAGAIHPVMNLKGTNTESELSLESLNAIERKAYSKKKSNKPLADITESVSGNNNAPIFVMECENMPRRKRSEVGSVQMGLNNGNSMPKENEDFQEIQLDENPMTQTDSCARESAPVSKSSPSKRFNFQLDFSKLHRNLDRERIHRKLLEAIIPKKASQTEIDKMDIL